jgi:hypothetical protein
MLISWIRVYCFWFCIGSAPDQPLRWTLEGGMAPRISSLSAEWKLARHRTLTYVGVHVGNHRIYMCACYMNNQTCYSVCRDITHWLTQRSRVVAKPIIASPIKKFCTIHGDRCFITVFTKALHWFLSWARSTQSILPRPISLRSILILSYHLCDLSLSFWLFPPISFMHYSHPPCLLHALPISSFLTWSL